MSERNHLVNGRFLHDLNGWTVGGGATYHAGDGDEHYGVAVLPTGGGFIEQAFAVDAVRVHTVHVALKPIGGAPSTTNVQLIITDGEGNTVVTENLLPSTADVWEELTFSYGLASGTNYTLKLINNALAGGIRVDDAWLWFVPMTRSEMATRVNRKLARLASLRSLSTLPNGQLTEGDFTDAVDAALRGVGAINSETGSPDVRYLDSESVQTALDAVEREMLEQLQRDYAVEVDVQYGPARENRSQIRAAIGEVIGLSGQGKGGGGRVVMRPLKYERKDFEY